MPVGNWGAVSGFLDVTALILNIMMIINTMMNLPIMTLRVFILRKKRDKLHAISDLV